jgi:pilus assembly protein CpaF
VSEARLEPLNSHLGVFANRWSPDETTTRRLVAEIQAQVNAAADARRADGGQLSQQQREALAEEALAAWFRREAETRIRQDHPALAGPFVEHLRALVRVAVSPLGPLAPFLNTSSWSDVQVNGARNVICTERGSETRTEYASPFTSDQAVFAWVAEQAAQFGRRFDEANPSVRFRLPNGVRVHAIGRVTSRTHIDCRLFLPGLDTVNGLAATGMFGDDIAQLLKASAAVREPIGIVFSGGTGEGKTTLLRAWLNAHPEVEVLDRIVTVEDEQELFLDHNRFRNLVEFEAREANVAEGGEYSMSRYLSHDLRRQSPQRVALGELRPDGGVMPLLLALGQGIAQGVATTIHAPTAADVLPRIRTYSAVGEVRLPETTVLETVAASVDLIIHVARVHGRRSVVSVREIEDYRDGVVASAELWRWEPGAGRAVRTDLAITDRLAAKLRAAGLDPHLLERDHLRRYA